MARAAAAVEPGEPGAAAVGLPCLRVAARAFAVAAAGTCAVSATATIIVTTCAATAAVVVVAVSGKICWSSATLCAAHYSLLQPCVAHSLTRLMVPITASLISGTGLLAPCLRSHGGCDGVHCWNCFDYPAPN